MPVALPRHPHRANDVTLLAHLAMSEQSAPRSITAPSDVIADIRCDLCIVPAHPLWRELAPAIMYERGRYADLIIEILKRPSRLPIPEDWRGRIRPPPPAPAALTLSRM
jgi:hypothetical protein